MVPTCPTASPTDQIEHYRTGTCKGALFPALEEQLGSLPERYQSFVTVLEFVRVDRWLPHFHGLPGRPQEDRGALARAFIAKAVFDITTTRALRERLTIDQPLRALVRLDRGSGGPQRGDLLACLCRIRCQRLAEPPA